MTPSRISTALLTTSAAGLLLSTVVAGTAAASGTNILEPSTTYANTVVLKVTNTDARNGVTCQVYGSGPTTFQSGLIKVGPRNSTTVTVGYVPAGQYTLSWGCNSFAQEKHFITVTGKTELSATPHIVPNKPVPQAGVPADLVGAVVGLLKGLGSVS